MMKIATTPMCQEILRLAGVSEFQIIKDGVYRDVDVAVVLSETKTHDDTSTEFIKLKLNTFKQIKESIKLISNRLGTEQLKEDLDKELSNQKRKKNSKIKVKAYSHFLREIAEDMGFTIVTDDSYDYLIYPDYLKKELRKELQEAGERAVKLPSHKNAPLNPVNRAEMRYQILENNICTKFIR
jgi:segregation and condensation protein B